MKRLCVLLYMQEIKKFYTYGRLPLCNGQQGSQAVD